MPTSTIVVVADSWLLLLALTVTWLLLTRHEEDGEDRP